MKLTLTSIFDATQVLASKAGQEMAPFVDYVTRAFEEVIRSLRNNLTFQDNFLCNVKTVSLKHGTTISIPFDKKVTGIIPVRVNHTSDSLDSLNWYYDSKGDLKITAYFRLAGDDSRSVTLIALF